MKSTLWEISKATFIKWNDDKVPKLSAALAYYTIFALAPTLIIAIGVAGLLFDRHSVQNEVMEQVRGLLGPTGADAVQVLLTSATKPGSGLTGTLLGVLTMLIGATGVFVELKDSLNMIWKVDPPEGQPWWSLIKDRFISMSLILGIGFMLIVSLVASALLTGLTTYMSGWLPLHAFWHLLDFAVSFSIMTGLFAMVFKILPDAEIAWRDVWLGSTVTSLLFTVGKMVIGVYLGRSSVASVYGAAGSFAIVLLWVYYTAQIVFLGAEFTQVHATKRKIVGTTSHGRGLGSRAASLTDHPSLAP